MANCRLVLKHRFNPMATVQFTNYDFESFAELDGSLYGVNEDGLFLLEGDDDDGTDIDSEFGFGFIDFAARTMKRLRFLCADIKSTGIDFTVETENGDIESYTLSASTETTTKKTSINRSLKGRRFEITFANIAGGDFIIGSIDLMVSFLAGRTR